MDIVGVENNISLFKGLQVETQLPDLARVVQKGAVTAVQPIDVYRLAAQKIEHAHIGRDDGGIAQLTHAGRALFAGEAGDEAPAGRRLPIGAGTPSDQRAEIRQRISRDIAVERELSKECQHFVA